MTFEWTAFAGPFALGLPTRASGYLLLGLLLLGALALLLTDRKEGSRGRRATRWNWGLLTMLVLAEIVAVQSLVLRLPLPEGVAAPSMPTQPIAPGFSLWAALPWMLAAGWLGTGPALLVGFLGGLLRAGFETHSLLTPFLYAFQALLAARLLRNRAVELPGRVMRHPAASGLLAGIIYGVLRALELFVYSGGDTYDGIQYMLAILLPVVVAGLMEAGLGGLAASVVKAAFPQNWYRPRRLRAGPYNRSLAARLITLLLVMGMAAGGALLYGGWLFAQATARDVLGSQIEQVTGLVGNSTPYFIQSGRVLIRQHAQALSSDAEAADLEAALGRGLRSVPFFTRLVLFSGDGGLLAAAPAGTFAGQSLPLVLERAVATAAAGTPIEVVIPQGEATSTKLVFLTPVVGAEGVPWAVLAGWTDLATNPMLGPAVDALDSIDGGRAYVFDGQGNVLLHSSGAELALPAFPMGVLGETVEATAPDGTRHLVHAEDVAGYSWRVVALIPLRTVNRLALNLLGRLTLILIAVGTAGVATLSWVSRRLTRPLEQMASAAEAIARGRLEQPLPMAGEDEIGRLAASFERMRRSLKARLEQMDLLLDMSRKMASTFQLEEVLPPILDGLQALVQADLVSLVLTPSAGDRGVESYMAGGDPGRWHSLDDQIFRLSRERGEFHLENPSRARAVLNLRGLTAPIESLMAFPVRHEDEFLGVLWLGQSTPGALGPDDRNLLSIVVGQLGVSIANANLYQRAERERLRLAAILEATPDAVLVTDREGRLSLANPAAEVVLRCKAEEAVGQPAEECLDVPELAALLQPGVPVRTAEIVTEGGRVLFASAQDVEEAATGRPGRVCVLWDITHYKELDTLKSEFVSTVSHDLRAPLTLMRGYATMLGMVGSLSEEQKGFVHKILDSVDHMTRLVSNLLDLGRIEAGVGLNLEEVAVEDVVREVVGAFRPQAITKNLVLEAEVAPQSRSIEADGTLLRQALANLVENAIKYTPAGGQVLVRTFARRDVQVFQVQDNGPGIAPTDQARLFEKFYRVRSELSLRQRGSGLGLAIVKSIVERHGGRVMVESKLGSGSTFSMEVPLRQPERRDEVPEAGQAEGGA